MAFDALEKMITGTPDYLEVPVEDGLLDNATAVIRSMGYDMESAISIYLRRIIQTPCAGVDKEKAEEHVRDIADTTLDDMTTQPLLIPRRDIFSVELADYAAPGFCSSWKPYFGSIEDISDFRCALYKDERRKPENMTFSSVHVYGSRYSSREAGNYEHTNIWGFPYFIWWDKLDSVHIWISDKGKYYRCVRARMKSLEYDTDPSGAMKHSPGEQIWGYPHVLEYRHPFHFNRMYVIEKQFKTEEQLLDDLKHYNGDIQLKEWLDDLFGDG